MAKLALTDISSGYLSTTVVNANNALIETALENTLSRDGTSPNTMSATLDMNSNRVINLAAPVGDNDAARKIDIAIYEATGLPDQTGMADKVLTTNGTTASWIDIVPVVTAADVSNTPAGSIAATDVQAAINELDTEKQPISSTLTTLASSTAAGLALMDDASASAQRTTLGLGTIATQASSAVAITGGTVAGVEHSNYYELKQTKVAATSTTIDYSLGQVVNLTQDTNITTLAFSNVPTTGKGAGLTIIRTKDATGTTRTISWPASIKWMNANPPTLTQTTGCVDIFNLITFDGGTTWYGTYAVNFA